MQAFCNTRSDFHMEKTVPVDKYGHLEKFPQKVHRKFFETNLFTSRKKF